MCVGVMYSGEYDVCNTTLSVYPRQGKLKSLLDHGGNRTPNRATRSSHSSSRLDLVAQLVEHWTILSIPKVASSILMHRGQANFSACPVHKQH